MFTQRHHGVCATLHIEVVRMYDDFQEGQQQGCHVWRSSLLQHLKVLLKQIARMFSTSLHFTVCLANSEKHIKCFVEGAMLPDWAVLLQHLKIQLKQITRIFTNPFQHLLLTALPWLPTARRDRVSYRAVEKVSLVCHARGYSSKAWL